MLYYYQRVTSLYVPRSPGYGDRNRHKRYFRITIISIHAILDMIEEVFSAIFSLFKTLG